MEWQPDESSDWIHDAERWIAKIKDVLQCKVEVDRDGEIQGVHVVARQGRDPRLIVRDVEGLLKARLGIAVFYKKIGVVQVVETDAPQPASPQTPEAPAAVAAEPDVVEPDVAEDDDDDDVQDFETDAILLAEELAPRIKCVGVGLMSTESVIRAEVQLQAAGADARGTCEGPNRSANDIELIATAALDAVGQLLDESVSLNLAEVRVAPLGGHDVVFAAVELIEGRRAERLFGTCQPQQNLHQAVVFAVLDALNRRLALMAFKSREATG